MDDEKYHNIDEIDEELLDEEELDNSADQQMTSHRQHFGRREYEQTRGDKDYYKNQTLAHKQRVEKAREESKKNNKIVKGKDGNSVKSKNLLDKINDKKNLGKAQVSTLGSKIGGIKSKAFTALHPVEAVKLKLWWYFKYKLLIILGVIILLILIVAVFVSLFGSEGNFKGGNGYSSAYSNTEYWWPIGSSSVDENNLYSGQPVGTTITSGYGYRRHPISGQTSFHNAIDIGIPTGTPIIAMADGSVSTVVTGCTVGNYSCGGGCGNYVVLAHKNGLTTMYCHNSSINVKVGDNVKQGQMIAKAGNTGSSTGPHLHFNVRLNGANVNPLDYVDPSDPRPVNIVGGSYAVGDFPLTETSLSKQEFKTALVNYANTHNVESYQRYLANNADTIYNASKSAGINPELVVARAMLEGFSPGGNTNNWWGINCTNTGGGRDCRTYPTLAAGIADFARIVKRNSSLEEMMSTYAYIGRYWYNPGSWSTGGCKYYGYIKGYMSAGRASTVNGICSSGRQCTTGGGSCVATTAEDQRAYTLYQVQRMTEVRNSVFM